jgi:hypothetical protein
VVQESVRQGITPLLYHRLQKSNPSADVPMRVTERLRELSVDSALQSLRLHQELSEVLRGLRSEGIPVIVLKGAYLAQIVYGDIALRSMRDVDVMVRKCDLSRAEAKLFAMGHSQLEHSHMERDYAGCQHLHPLIRPGGFPIEIHWTIESPTEPFEIDVDGLWERARPAVIAGVEVLVLSPEDLLLHLCLHTSFHHQFVQGLRSCWDILKTVGHYGPQIDWEQVRHRSRQWGVEKYVYLTLYLVRELFGAAVPVQVLASLKPNHFEPRLIALARQEILTGPTPTATVSPTFARMWGTMRVREKASLLAKTVFPSRKAMGRTYPEARDSRWSYRYYPVRWKDLLLKYGRSVWRLIRRDVAVAALVQREQERAILMDWLKSS